LIGLFIGLKTKGPVYGNYAFGLKPSLSLPYYHHGLKAVAMVIEIAWNQTNPHIIKIGNLSPLFPIPKGRKSRNPLVSL